MYLFSVYGPEKRILISGKNKGCHCWANQSWPTSLWQNESSRYLYANQSPFRMDKDYNHQLFTTFIHRKCCHVFLVCSMDKCNNSILFFWPWNALNSALFLWLSSFIELEYLLFHFRTLDLTTKNISLIFLFDQAAYLFLSFKTFHNFKNWQKCSMSSLIKFLWLGQIKYLI